MSKWWITLCERGEYSSHVVKFEGDLPTKKELDDFTIVTRERRRDCCHVEHYPSYRYIIMMQKLAE